MTTKSVEPINVSLLEVSEYTGAGYRPLVDFGAWRVAILRYGADMLPENIERMQRHDQTDEVFVLLAGHAILFLGEGADQVTAIHAVNLEPLKLYNVKRSAWHNHTLSKDACVLIVENRDTVAENSPQVALTPAQRQRLVELTHSLW